MLIGRARSPASARRRPAPSPRRFAALAGAPRPAAANGVFPSAGQLVVDPGDPSRILVMTTHGLLTTRDGGRAWGWICEEAVDHTAGHHPPLAITADGSVLAGVLGLRVGRGDGCGWSQAPGARRGLHRRRLGGEGRAGRRPRREQLLARRRGAELDVGLARSRAPRRGVRVPERRRLWIAVVAGDARRARGRGWMAAVPPRR